MSDVFISYSKEDANTARLIDKLTAAGFSVWWDRRILPGKTWDVRSKTAGCCPCIRGV